MDLDSSGWKFSPSWSKNAGPMKNVLTTLVCVALTWTARADLKTQTVEYKDGATVLEGYLAYDTAFTGKRPAVLVVHQWKGLTEYERKRCEMLAKQGYVAFAVDIYGKGIRPTTVQDAGAQAGKYKSDRALLRQRVNAGLNSLKQQDKVDAGRIAAIGYCFGGTTVIELARSGAKIAGVVSFHGGLDSPTPADGKNINCRVLALHGADDPFVPDKDLTAFEGEMRDGGVDWQLIKYGGAVHSFTDWDAQGDLPGAKYNERADKRSWEDMLQFLNENFK
jgi:dienelactone hydrolase